MKKKICYLLIAIMMFTMMPATAMEALAAEIMPTTVVDSGKCGDDLTWTLDSDGTLTISGEGDMENYYTPFTSPWEPYRSEVNKLIIEEGITSIGTNAFYKWNEFKGDLEIPNSVTLIKQAAFKDCSGFINLKLSNEILEIEGRAFDGCSGFTGDLKLPSSLTSIGDYSFYGCSGFTGELKLPESITVLICMHLPTVRDLKVN